MAALAARAAQAQGSPVPALAGQLSRAAAPAVNGWLAAVQGLVDGAQSLQEIRDGLERLLPDMQLGEYAAAMAQALSCAQLAGRYEVLQEAAALGHSLERSRHG